MTLLTGENFIAGKRSAQGTVQLSSQNATTGERLGINFIQATEQEVASTVAAAAEAYVAFRQLLPAQRADFLDHIADELDALDDAFIFTVCGETALPEARIRGERARTSGQMRLFATVLRRGDFLNARIDTALPDRQPLARPDLRQYRIGVGPVAVFGASNFPLAFSTAGGDTASALAAGCPVVFKAHSGHLATSEWVAGAIWRAADKSQISRAVFSLVYGSVGDRLVKAPEISAVGFTGSLRGGRALADMAAARPQPIPVFAEMSSINPVLVLPQALAQDSAKIAADLAASIVMGCGQFCTNPGLVLGVKSPDFSRFQHQLSEQIQQKAAQTMLNVGTLASYQQGIKALQSHPLITTLAQGGNVAQQATACLFKADAQLLLQQEPLLQEEVFGPASVVVEVENEEALLQAVSSLQGQLTATLIATPEDLHGREPLVAILEQKVGRLLLNGYPTGVEVSDAMVHGGPYPATSDARGTSVGTFAIDRFLRPVCYQNYPDTLLPVALQDANPLGITRLVNGVTTRAAL